MRLGTSGEEGNCLLSRTWSTEPFPVKWQGTPRRGDAPAGGCAGTPPPESWESSGYLTGAFCIQFENPCHGNFLICVLLLFHEPAQEMVLRMTVITGKQSWNPRGWLLTLYAALTFIKEFVLSCTPAVQMSQLPLHQTIGNDSCDWKHWTYAMTNFQFLFSLREAGHFTFHFFYSCLDAWIATTLCELGCSSVTNLWQNRSSRGSFYTHILCIARSLFKDLLYLFSSEARLQKT